MAWIIGIVAVVVVYFVLAKKRGDAFTKRLVQGSVQSLLDSGESRAAVGAFTGTTEFTVVARGSFGKLSIDDAMGAIYLAYDRDCEKYRAMGEAQPHLADNVDRILPEG